MPYAPSTLLHFAYLLTLLPSHLPTLSASYLLIFLSSVLCPMPSVVRIQHYIWCRNRAYYPDIVGNWNGILNQKFLSFCSAKSTWQGICWMVLFSPYSYCILLKLKEILLASFHTWSLTLHFHRVEPDGVRLLKINHPGNKNKVSQGIPLWINLMKGGAKQLRNLTNRLQLFNRPKTKFRRYNKCQVL